jgi:hypothetical protein
MTREVARMMRVGLRNDEREAASMTQERERETGGVMTKRGGGMVREAGVKMTRDGGGGGGGHDERGGVMTKERRQSI